MLRKQSVHDPMDFLSGNGEMARLTRNYDWASHPFGPPQTWSQSLRSALSICLNSAFPTCIYWGPELRLLYNDAWAPIPGPRHPDALGARAQDVWADIWHIIQPQFAELVRTGEGLFVEDQMLPMRRFGFDEETYWNYSFTPLRAEDGRIVGIFNSGSETTDKVIQKRNSEFLITLNQDLRACGKTDDALDLALSRLGELLGATRVGIRERVALNGAPAFSLTSEWCAQGVASSEESVDLSLFAQEQVNDLLSGRIVQISLSDPEYFSASNRFLEAAGISGLLAIPWSENGEVVSVIYVHTDAPRAYGALHVSTVEKVLETTMGWIERERHRDRERIMAAEIDHRARNMLAVIQSIIRMTKGADVDDVKAKLVDRLTALARVHSLLGRKRWSHLEFRDILEDELAPLGAEIYDRVTLKGPRLKLSTQEAQLFAMILHELTTNSLKYGSMAQDAGRLSVKWTVDEHRNMSLEWRESGLPVAPDRMSSPPKKKGFGSVLLSNVVQAQFGGEVVRKVTEDGLTYNFQLSLNSKTLAQTEGPSPQTESGDALSSALSVMVVEDDALISLDLTELLTDEGYRVFGQFGNVDKALEALRTGSPDLALLDADLGGESSAPVAALLNARSVPFVVVTGHGDDFPADDPRASAPRIEKPIANAELMSVLKRSADKG